ncbi:MAG: hypothetical protein HY823_06425 [Acidobacteria bacterium]|nr:hypothetical protein [Acidobacteriota bacterium]
MSGDLITLVGTGIQTAGVWALTLLMFLTARALKLSYLRTWTLGWLWLAIALSALQVSFRVPAWSLVFQPLYHFGELAFLWCLGLGIGRAGGGDRPPRALSPYLVPAVLVSMILPWATPSFTASFVVQASLLAAGFLGVFVVLHKASRDWGGNLGLWITKTALILLSLDFAFHAMALGGFLVGGLPLPPAYSGFTSLYDFLFEMVLAFGLVVLALQDAASRIRTLTRLLPVCAWCRKVRDDQGYWSEFELWVKSQGQLSVTHGICPACKERTLSELELNPAPKDRAPG